MALKMLEIGYRAGEIFDFYRRPGLCAEGYDFSEAAYQHAARVCRKNDIALHRAMPEGKSMIMLSHPRCWSTSKMMQAH